MQYDGASRSDCAIWNRCIWGGGDNQFFHQLYCSLPVVMLDKEDNELVQNCLNGDSKAFERLIEKYEKPVFNAALKIVGDFEDARDVTQTVFVKAFEKLEINEALNFTDKRKRQTSIDPGQIATAETPEVIYDRKKLSGHVDKALAELPLEYRLVIIFRHWVDLPYRDIGYILGIEENKVKSRLYTARRLLADIMTKRGLVTYG